MSLATWKKEFYPIAAQKCSKKGALAHSLRKWRGLTKTNLKKHKIGYKWGYIGDSVESLLDMGPVLSIDSGSCALCVHFYNTYPDTHPCTQCPIYTVTEKSCEGAYNELIYADNPRPMIALLEKVQKALMQKTQKEH